MLRALSTVGGFTLMSRVTGMVREMAMARVFGTGIFADAFYAAFRLPNMFRRIFGEGAFNSAFVPLFNRELVEGDHASAERFASNAFSWLGAVLIAGTLVAIPGMPWFAKALVPGFDEAEFGVTVAYARIMFSYLLCIALSAQLSGVLNSLKVFSMPAFAPVLLNVFWVAALVVIVPLAHLKGQLYQVGEVAAWAVLTAGLAQLLLLWVSCFRHGMRVRPMIPRMSPRIRRLLVLMGPGVIAAGVQQVNILIGQQIASFEAGAVAALTYADRLYQLPNGMIGAAFGVVLLPEISRLLRSGDERGAKDTIGNGVLLSMLVTLPAAVALAVIPTPFVRALYEGGKFGAESVSVVSVTTIGFAFGIPAFVLMKVFQAGYFARENTKAPLKIAVVTVIVNTGLSLALFPHLKTLGIAIATTVASWVNVLLLVRGLRGKIGLTRDRLGKLARTLAAAVAMGLAVWFCAPFLQPWIDGAVWQKWVAALSLVTLGAGVYAFLALALRATSLSELKAGFKK